MGFNIYVAGSLTNSSTKEFYEQIGNVAESFGCSPYIPHRFTDPVKNANVSPEDVYRIDMEKIGGSDLLIACVTNPSLGVGAELEFATLNHIPIVLVYKNGSKVSRLIRGMPTIEYEVSFDNEMKVLLELAEIIVKMKRLKELKR